MDCISSACLANVMQAATATLSWLVGRHDFFVNVVTEGSRSSSSSSSSRSSSSDGAPKAPMGGNFKLDMPVSTDGKMRSSSTINLSADATDGPQTLKQATAKSSKKKSGKQNKRKGSESVRNRTKAAGHEAAKTAEKKKEEKEEEEDINTSKVAARGRGSQGKKRTGAAAHSSAPLSIKETVQHGPELITGMAQPCIS